ncbi:ethanolamine utilization protein EutJ [Chromobacterium alkanivorans]|uniref:ethanolamine utilization protein EutJ n=1 Tax=Chromobacterium alkanivorans TaxID=1071719 RepID=UPI00196842AB|nr:ethanolamine utilization protein EutJ [Chromobacterium alkanivorans]MBN3002276.1 ethanolamine utilization protein EutJ [Chromobacterium alkanivorans]
MPSPSLSPHQLQQRLNAARALHRGEARRAAVAGMRLGIDLGTSDVVSVAMAPDGEPLALRLDWADVVRDGVVWNFFGAVDIVRRQLDALEQALGHRFAAAATSYPPGTDPRISVNVLEAAGLEVSGVIDEPSAVVGLLGLSRAAVVDIGGGTTGIAIVENGRVSHSADEATGGHHVSLALAGHSGLPLAEAEILKRERGAEVWPVVRPVFEKMCDIVRRHLTRLPDGDLYLSGGSCSLPGVRELFRREFPAHRVHLPEHPLYLTPLAIAHHALAAQGANHASR